MRDLTDLERLVDKYGEARVCRKVFNYNHYQRPYLARLAHGLSKPLPPNNNLH